MRLAPALLASALAGTALVLGGCGSLTGGIDAGGVAERSGELDGYVESYNRINAGTAVNDLGSLSTRTGGYGAIGFGLDGERYGSALRLGLAQGKRGTSVRFDDATERRMRLRYASFFSEADAGFAHGPRVVVGVDIRNTYLQALLVDVDGNVSDTPRGCFETNTIQPTCTIGRFSTLTTAVYAGATYIVRLRGESGVRISLTRPVLDGGDTTDGRLHAFGDYPYPPDYGFPRSIDDASPDRRRAVPALLRPLTLRLALSINGKDD